MTFAEKLRYIRKAYSMTQAELAQTIGVSRGNIANLELGNVHPTPMFLNCLALTFHLDKDWLMNEQNNNLPILQSHLPKQVAENFSRLQEDYQAFVAKQIEDLLALQESTQK